MIDKTGLREDETTAADYTSDTALIARLQQRLVEARTEQVSYADCADGTCRACVKCHDNLEKKVADRDAMITRYQQPLHAAAPLGMKCADCTMGNGVACWPCYRAWWRRENPHVHFHPDDDRTVEELGRVIVEHAHTIIRAEAAEARVAQLEAECAALRKENERIDLLSTDMVDAEAECAAMRNVLVAIAGKKVGDAGKSAIEDAEKRWGYLDVIGLLAFFNEVGEKARAALSSDAGRALAERLATAERERDEARADTAALKREFEHPSERWVLRRDLEDAVREAEALRKENAAMKNELRTKLYVTEKVLVLTDDERTCLANMAASYSAARAAVGKPTSRVDGIRERLPPGEVMPMAYGVSHSEVEALRKVVDAARAADKRWDADAAAGRSVAAGYVCAVEDLALALATLDALRGGK